MSTMRRRAPMLGSSMRKDGNLLAPSGLSAERAGPTTFGGNESWPYLRVAALRLSVVFLAAAAVPLGAQQRPWELRDFAMPGGNFYVRVPAFVDAARAAFLTDDDRVVGIAGDGTAKAYPADVVVWHHGIEDRIGEVPVFVTWCNECNTAMVYRAQMDGRDLMFFHTNMVSQNMTFADRETRTRWQQQTGEAIEGPLKGRRLPIYPFVLTSWKEWRDTHPGTLVMEPLAGFEGLYAVWRDVIRWRRPGRAVGASAERVQREDTRLPAYEPVVGVSAGGAQRSYPRAILEKELVVNDSLGGEEVLLLYVRASDMVTVFSRKLGGRILNFERRSPSGDLVDRETASRWNAYGECLDGPLRGSHLTALLGVPQFWWAWTTFYPATDVYAGMGAAPKRR
ncbi:MAG: DUF3179 domain-containing (seleno)protein [Acidobacteriota bacterium]